MPKKTLKAKGKKKEGSKIGNIKSAAELGIKADSLGITKKKPVTHKGKKILEAKAGKLIEDPKCSIFLKGKKTSQKVMDLMRDLHLQRGNDLSKLFLRKNRDIFPFEDIGPVEYRANHQSCSLFMLGSHQKKRPDNLVMGRLFDSHILDMFEFSVTDYTPMIGFKQVDVNNVLKPILIF